MQKHSEADQLVAALRECKWRQYFADRRAKNSRTDWPTIIRDWVGPNTFRAFHNMPQKPSKVFRGWACEALVEKHATLTNCWPRSPVASMTSGLIALPTIFNSIGEIIRRIAKLHSDIRGSFRTC